MDDVQQLLDLRRFDHDPELFGIARALRHLRVLIQYGGSDIKRPDDDSAFHPHHLEAFLARTMETPWKDRRMVQEWRRLQLFLPRRKEAWERGKTLFQEDLDRAKSDQENLVDFFMIEFAVDGYTSLSASRAYPDDPALQNWAINGSMLMWREYFLKDQEEGEDSTDVGL
jgi:hypothetical protein